GLRRGGRGPLPEPRRRRARRLRRRRDRLGARPRLRAVVTPRPTIGITASLETVTSGPWVEPSTVVPFHYCEAVQRAGGRAVLLVPDQADADDPGELLDLVDGVLFTGASGDLDPARYGDEERHPATHPVPPLRDEFELALVQAAAKR